MTGPIYHGDPDALPESYRRRADQVSAIGYEKQFLAGRYENIAEVDSRGACGRISRVAASARLDGLSKLAGKVFRMNDLMLTGTLCEVETGFQLAGVPHKQCSVAAALHHLVKTAPGNSITSP